MRKALASILCVLFITSTQGAGWFKGDGVKVTTVKVDSPDEIKFTGIGQPTSMRAFLTNQIEIVAIKNAVTNNQPQVYLGSWNLNSSQYYSEIHAASGKYATFYNGNGNVMLQFDPSGYGVFDAPSKGAGYGVTVGGWDQNGMFASAQLGGNVSRAIYILPALDAATNAQARVGIVETNMVTPGDTNGWVVSSHSDFLTAAATNNAHYLSLTTGATVTQIVNEVGTANGWSTNTAWTWQGAQSVAVETSAYSVAYGGPAMWNAASNRYELLPYSTTNYGAITGTVTIVMSSNRYLSSIGETWNVKTVEGTTGQTPVFYDTLYSSTSAVLFAWCSTNPADAASPYWAYFSNLVVYSYDRPMTPGQYTNDTAGIVARVDTLLAGNSDARRVVNAESLTAAIAAAKPDIALEAWRYMPSGARQPTYSAVTIDKPLILQSGDVTFMQSGDYFAQSYAGVWDSSVTGGTWAIGPSGTKALQIDSTNILLAISSFSVRTNTASFVIATNWVVGTPRIEYCADLMAPLWLRPAGLSVSSNASSWAATCPTVATMMFYRAVSPGGASKITSHYPHTFRAGISDGTTSMASRSLYVVTNAANGSGCTISGFFNVTP
jgi:hypothetical protein